MYRTRSFAKAAWHAELSGASTGPIAVSIVSDKASAGAAGSRRESPEPRDLGGHCLPRASIVSDPALLIQCRPKVTTCSGLLLGVPWAEQNLRRQLHTTWSAGFSFSFAFLGLYSLAFLRMRPQRWRRRSCTLRPPPQTHSPQTHSLRTCDSCAVH